MYKYTAIIPVRAGSRRLKDKNISKFGKSNLLENKIDMLKKVNSIDNIIVSSDSDKMLEMAIKKNVKTHKRTSEYCDEKTQPFGAVVKHVCEAVDSENIIWTPVTAPLISSKTYLKSLDAENNGVSGEDLKELQDAVRSAGENFESTVNKAAVSFKNKMVALEKGIADIDKQKSQLRAKESEASEKFIDRIVSGEKGRTAAPMIDAITNFKAFMAKLQARQAAVEGAGGKFQVTADESRSISLYRSRISQAGSSMGLDLSATEILKSLTPKIADLLSGEGPFGAKSRGYGIIGGGAEFDEKIGIDGALKDLLDKEGLSEDKAIEELTRTQNDLKAQLDLTRKNYEKLNTDADTTALATNINFLSMEMEMAAQSLFELNSFSSQITQTVTDTSGLIETNANFVATQKTLINSLTKELASLKVKVDDLTSDSDLK